jgi:predicted RNase H-like nuclease
MIAGVDGCRNGWLAAIEAADDEILVVVFETFKSLIENADMSLIVIDVPIGLPNDGHRACDDKAREFLQARGSSVFPAPLRRMLEAARYEQPKLHQEACRIRWEIEGKKCSKQLSAIIPKIHEVDECMNPDVQTRVFEGHPEVSFAYMNDKKPLCSKHTREGLEQRVKLLETLFRNARIRLTDFAPLKADGDDVLDAVACLWTARRVRDGWAERLPTTPEFDQKRLRMEIVA